jgi:hypothetical protein
MDRPLPEEIAVGSFARRTDLRARRGFLFGSGRIFSEKLDGEFRDRFRFGNQMRQGVNGQARQLNLEPRVTLLDALRNLLMLSETELIGITVGTMPSFSSATRFTAIRCPGPICSPT